jgi:glutathione synthase/RimK-type ligase-like ATP-grasp enzyme
MPHIAIITVQEDFHAHVIGQVLRDRHHIDCSITETSRIAGSGGLTWSLADSFPPTIPTIAGQLLDVRQIDLIWWRSHWWLRGGDSKEIHRERLPVEINDEAAIDVILNDCMTSFMGVLTNNFHGRWINSPEASRKADNKLAQLQIAQEVGLNVPKTLISQNPEHIRQFCASLDNQAILKAVSGTRKAPLATVKIREDLLASEQGLRLSPAIYQALIPGNRHLRVNVFGDRVYTALISSEHLDWRIYLDQAKVEPFKLPAETQKQLLQFMKILDLRMGAFDLKLTDQGELVWLELNQQGDFLFIEGLSGLKLADAFADFLCGELESNSRRETDYYAYHI